MEWEQLYLQRDHGILRYSTKLYEIHVNYEQNILNSQMFTCNHLVYNEKVSMLTSSTIIEKNL
jgi:hypothetical protein